MCAPARGLLVERITETQQVQVHALVGCFDVGIRDVLKAVGNFVLAFITETQPETYQAAKLEGS